MLTKKQTTKLEAVHEAAVRLAEFVDALERNPNPEADDALQTILLLRLAEFRQARDARMAEQAS